MRRDIDELFVSPDHLAKCTYEVVTRDHRSITYYCIHGKY